MQDARQLADEFSKEGSSALVAALSRGGGLRAGAAIAFVVLTFIFLWPSTASLLVRWQDTVHRTYTHGMLIVAVCLWMIWRARTHWTTEPARASVPASVVLLALGFLWLIAYRAGLQIVHQALVPLLAFAAIAACLGPPLALRMWLPIGYLYLAIPVWDAINPILQWISVMAVRLLLRVFGIPAYFSGDTFHIPAGSFEIASGCSGLHFFVVALAIAVLYGQMSEDNWKTRAKLVVLAGALAMMTNWVRVFIIVLAGHLTEMQHYLVSGEHYSFGWFMFAGVMLMYFLIVRRWPLNAVRPTARAIEGADSRGLRRGFALALAALVPVGTYNLFDRNVAEMPIEALSPQVAGWESYPSPVEEWRPVFKGADAEERLAYRTTDSVLELYTAIYLYQQQGKEAVGYENSLLGSGLVAQASPRTAQRGWAELRTRDLSSEEWMLWYVYRIDESWYSKPLHLQLAYGFKSLLSAPLTSIVAVRTPCAGDCEAASERLDQFTANAWP